MSRKSLPAHEIGSGNIFADLGLPNPEEHQLKAALVVQLGRIIKSRKLTQTAAAKTLGVKQPDLSNILRGHYRGYSVERLMRMLTAFDQDIEIVVKPRKKTAKAGRITFIPAPA
jgi:predicted XRE-type DNA-binding protein